MVDLCELLEHASGFQFCHDVRFLIRFMCFFFVICLYCAIFASIIVQASTAKLQKMIETLLCTVLIIAIAMILLCVRVILKKNGSFQSQHIHDNAALRKQGIHCVIDQDREARMKSQAM